MKKLLFGTHNPHKIDEIKQILGNDIQIIGLKELAVKHEVDEIESTLEGNALLKAIGYYNQTNIPCFSDDTGLEVAVLQGAPGVRSARYAGNQATSEDNVQKLLKELHGLESRQARFRTVIAFYDGLEQYTFEGIVNGKIIHSPQGNNGFGYDPIFVPDGYQDTFAQMPSEEKHRISHRAKAMNLFIEYLKESFLN